MTVTELDPCTALVVIDLQNGVTAAPTVGDNEVVVANSARLAAAFREKGLPVVLVRVTPSADGSDALRPRTDASPRQQGERPAGYADLRSELGPAEGDIVITKRQWDAFYGTELDLQLRRRHVTGIVLTGIATSFGVESTARSAYSLGYQIAIPTDAVTDLNAAVQETALTVIFPRLGQMDTTEHILAVVAGLPATS